MSQSKSWKLFIVGIGFLLVCVSPLRAQAGQTVNLPLFIGGIITALIGFVLYRRDGRA